MGDAVEQEPDGAGDTWPPHGIAAVTATAGLALAGYAWRTRRRAAVPA